MSSDAFILQGTIDVDIDDAVNSLNRVDKQVDSSGKSMSGVFGKLGAVIAGAFAVDKIVDFGKKCLSAASDVQEMQNKFDVVFEKTGESMNKWAEDYADAIGRSSFDIKTAIQTSVSSVHSIQKCKSLCTEQKEFPLTIFATHCVIGSKTGITNPIQ